MKTPEQRIEELQRKLTLEKKKLADQQRKKETRQKIILGGFLLEKAKANPQFAQIIEQAKQGLKRDADREAFGLSPIKKETNQEVQNQNGN